MFLIQDESDGDRKVVCVGTASQAISRLERMMQDGVLPTIRRIGGTEIGLKELVSEIGSPLRDRSEPWPRPAAKWTPV